MEDAAVAKNQYCPSSSTLFKGFAGELFALFVGIVAMVFALEQLEIFCRALIVPGGTFLIGVSEGPSLFLAIIDGVIVGSCALLVERARCRAVRSAC